jgi:superfamily I DNA/RNA helicase
MTPFERAIGRARDARSALLGSPTVALVPAQQVLASIPEKFQLAVAPVAPTSKSLAGADAALRRKEWTIYVRNDLSPELASMYIAHELGHFHLDPETDPPDAVLKHEQVTGIVGSSGTALVEAYGARERLELAANVFARELLLPAAVARAAFAQGFGAHAISKKIALPLDMVRQQLLDAVLLPNAQEAEPAPHHELTDEQRDAAHASERYVNVIAGPGTGKTACLIERARYLMEDRGVEGSRIAALTFTNKAAASLVDRLRPVEGSHGLWAGTFHGFGLEFLRKFHQHFDLPSDVQVVDDLEAVLLLQPLVQDLSLLHYSCLDDPLGWLPEALNGVHRLKEELVLPADFRQWVDQQADCAERARWNDTAELYTAYDRALREAQRVDFVDLVARPALALRAGRAPYSEFIDRFDHVLVDEYQDVTQAMVTLLRQFGAHKSIWVVGDLRQAIHHWRGASFKSLLGFQQALASPTSSTKEYRLRINHRSTEQIARAIQVAGEHHLLQSTFPMGAVVARDDRQGPKPVIHELMGNDVASALAGAITAHRDDGVAYRSQMVVARSNEELEHLASELRACGVPVLYVGDLNRHPATRQLLCLMSLLVHRHPTALVGLVADELAIGADDASLLMAACRDDPTLQQAGWLANPPSELSAFGQAVVARLAQMLAHQSRRSSPWDFICDLVLEQRLGIPPLGTDEIDNHVARLALWQLAYSARATNINGSVRTLVRFLVARRLRQQINDVRAEREVPAQALSLDAVRLLTVHSSKGLEAAAVHLMGLPKVSFGSETPWFGLPFHLQFVPSEACRQSAEEYANNAAIERNNLLFVALSRAQTHLHCYVRPTDEAKALPVYAPLRAISSVMSHAHGVIPNAPDLPTPAAIRELFSYEDFVLYSKCARRFHYRVTCEYPEQNPAVEAKQALRAINDALGQVANEHTAPAIALKASWNAQRLPEPAQVPGLWRDANTAFGRAVDLLSGIGATTVRPQTTISNTTIDLPWMTRNPTTGKMAWFVPLRLHKQNMDRIRPLLNHMAPLPAPLSVVSLVDGSIAEPSPSGWIEKTTPFKTMCKNEEGITAPTFGIPCRRCGYTLICPSLPR